MPDTGNTTTQPGNPSAYSGTQIKPPDLDPTTQSAVDTGLVTSGGQAIRQSNPSPSTLDAQTTAALNIQAPNINKNPTYTDMGNAVGTQQYLDKFGRIATGQVDNQGRIISGTSQTSNKPPPKPTTPTTPTTVGPPPSSITAAPPSGVTPLGQKPDLSLTNLSGLLNIGQLGIGTYNLATSGAAANIATGTGSGLLNSINTWGANNIPGLAAPGSVASGATTLTASIGYGNFGGFAASLLGLSSDNPLANLAEGTIGGIAGGAIGSSIGGTVLGIGAGALGGFIGGFAVVALASLLAGHPSEKLAYGNVDLSTGAQNTGSYQGAKYSPQNNSSVGTLLQYTGTLASNLQNTLGANINIQGGISWGVDSRHGITMQLGGLNNLNVDAPQGQGYLGSYKNGQDAMNAAGLQMLQHATFTNSDTQYAASNINWDGMTFDQATGALGYANDFSKTADNFLNGTFNIDQGKNSAIQTITAWASQASNVFQGKNQDDYMNRAGAAASAAINKVVTYYQTHPDTQDDASTPYLPTPTAPSSQNTDQNGSFGQ